jgi:acetolactate synthase-1/3 small subunit
VSGILAGRGFNIDSLVVCRTEIRDLSRMCIVLKGQEGVVEQARRQLEDLVPVWAVLDYTDTPKIQRELLLVKVSLLGPEYLEDQLVGGPHHDPRLNAPDVATAAANAKYQAEAHFAQAFASGGRQEPPRVVTGEAKLTGEMPSVEEQIMAEGQAGTDPSNPLTDPESGVSVLGSSDAGPTVPSESSPLASSAVHAAAQAQADYPHVSASSQHPAPLTPSQALALRAQHMAAISGLAQQFGGRLVDVSENSAIVELAGKTQRVDAFLRLLSPYGILESARSGMMTLPRTPLRPTDEEEGPEDPSGLGVDASMLPPG